MSQGTTPTLQSIKRIRDDVTRVEKLTAATKENQRTIKYLLDNYLTREEICEYLLSRNDELLKEAKELINAHQPK